MRATRVVALLVTTAVVLTACSGDGDSAQARAAAAARTFAEAWQSGESTGSPQADDLIAEVNSALQVSSTAVDVSEGPTCNDDETVCRAPAEVTLTMQGLGEWSYDTELELAPAEADGWQVSWTPQTLHPRLTSETRLERQRELPARASILGAGGERLTRPTSVLRVGVVAGKVKPATYGQLAELLDIDPAGLRQQVRAADPEWFVPVITIRRPQYGQVRGQLLQVPGISVNEDTWSLTKASSWGRALVGTVAPATAETLEQAGPLAGQHDVVGASGLQLAFQRQLAGEPGGVVELVDAESDATVEELFTKRPQRGEPLRTTLDADVQNAAEAAVGTQDKTTALVAMRAGTGEILASAVGPGAQSYNSAFVGRYPPGSTFKIVSAAALLGEEVLDAGTPVPCPPTTTVNGKSFKNYDDFQAVSADPTFAQDIAASCNTAVVSRAEELDADALTDWAGRLGLGADVDLGVPAFIGDVPLTEDVVDRAASMIGQGRVLASPLGMATMAAAVKAGSPVTPKLLQDADAAPQAEPLDPGLGRDLQEMMRLTVTDGTASSLDLPGEPVHAKTGTAELDSDDPSKTHAWIVGFRGDLAFAVLVENGVSGSEDAAPVVRAFLERVPQP